MKKTCSFLLALVLLLSFSLVTATPVAAYPGTTYYVSTSGNDTTGNGTADYPWRTIQYAVGNVSAGDTIMVAAGTYVEIGQIVISKNLTITGANKATTIIKPAQNTSGSGDGRGWFLVNAGNQFNLSNVTLDGSGYKVYQGIRDQGSGTIANCNFNNIQYEPSGPTYYGQAMVIFGNGNVNVTGCTFTAIGRVGVLYYGTGVTGSTFSNNTYTGKGTGNWLDYGVEVGNGATATITGNTITNCRGVASVDNSTSAGILVSTYFGAGTTATITSNTLTGNTGGIAVGINPSDTSTVVAHKNNITGNINYGINTTAPLVDATLNWWGNATGPYHPTANPGGKGNNVSGNVTFAPWLMKSGGTETTETKTAIGVNAWSYTTTASAMATGGTSNTTLTLAEYAANPGGSPPIGFTALGKYIDVYVPVITGVTKVEIRLYYTAADVPTGVSEGSLRLFSWNGTEWVHCSARGVNTTDDYMWAEIRGDTTPTLAQLTGTPFGGMGVMVYNLTMAVSPVGSGTATDATNATPYAAGTVVNITALPVAGYRFANWTANTTVTFGNATAAVTNFTMPAQNVTVTANFQKVPAVTTQAATDITSYSAIVNMSYTVGNFSSVEVRFACKRCTDQAWFYYTWVSRTADGTYTEVLTGLVPQTMYEFKAQLKYNGTVIEGATLLFTTTTGPSTGLGDLVDDLLGYLGCFIATAAYGTPTAEQIDVLREFRDVVLLESAAGSRFVALYYRLSPPIADFIARSDLLRTLVRELLVDPIVWIVEATGAIWRN